MVQPVHNFVSSSVKPCLVERFYRSHHIDGGVAANDMYVLNSCVITDALDFQPVWLSCSKCHLLVGGLHRSNINRVA